MASYFFAFGWGILILLSLVGWGSVLNRLLFAKDHTDWGQRAAWGLALSVVVGGCLNLLTCISRATILIWLGLGTVAWIIGSVARWPWRFKSSFQQLPELRDRKTLLVIGVLIVACMALLRYAASVSIVHYDIPSGAVGRNRFSPLDDFQAYFVFPEKMLQAGSMGRDPFCARRLESSLGGQSFLDTLVLSTLSVQNLHIMDYGVGLLLIIGLLGGNFKERGTPPAWSVSLLLLFLWMGPGGAGRRRRREHHESLYRHGPVPEPLPHARLESPCHLPLSVEDSHHRSDRLGNLFA